MTFQQIKYIVEISRAGSISKAAKSLFVTQPYLSNLLRELEGELSITIFNRSSKGITLTEEGREFLRYAQPLLEQRDKLVCMYTEQKVAPTTRFDVALQRFPFVIKAFIDLFNENRIDRYEFHVREVSMYRVINYVYEKKSDIGILCISNISENFILKTLDSRGLEFVLIKELSPFFFFGAHHPMSARKSINIHEMQPYPYISFEEEAYASVDFSEEILLRDFSPPQKRIYIEDRATMGNILTYTNAFSIGTGILTPGYTTGPIIGRPVAGYENSAKFGYIKCKGSVMSDLLTRFVEDIAKHVVQ